MRALRLAFELGINFIDTAPAYGDGQSEKSVGRAMRESDLPIVIATKILPADRVWPARTGARFDGIFSRQYVMDCTDISLRNLGVDRVDLQQFHLWNSRWTQGEEWRRLFEDLKRSGKVLYPGVSVTEHDPDSGIELVKSGLVDSLQVIYNIFDPWAADRLFPVAAKNGVGTLARVPLDEGALTGSIREDSVFKNNDFRAPTFEAIAKGKSRNEFESFKAIWAT